MANLFDVEAASKKSEKSVRVKELARLIKKYQDSYYNGEAEISDAEFDSLWDELKSLDPQNPILKKVGADSGNFPKARHIMPMGSQEKAADPEQFLAWAKKHAYDEYLVEYKLDGASLELQYENGTLVRAVTRGDGTIGDDITVNAKKMRGVIQILKGENSSSFTGGVRGEVIMTHSTHEKFFSDKANCRNAANGLMKRKDGEGAEHLELICYDALSTEGKNPFSDEEEKIEWLVKNGFTTVPLYIAKSADDVVNYRAEVMEKRASLEYDIDGLVVKERAIDFADASRARPERQIAFKFSLEEAVSIVRSVEWSESGATYTPVAIFDPVELAGTTVRRASLANPETLRKLGVKFGSHVVGVKRGEIIPKIESVVKENVSAENEDFTQKEIEFPKKCASCGSELSDTPARLYCPNKNCPKRILHQIFKWIECADIRDLGEATVNELFAAKKINSISSLYDLTEEILTPFFLDEKSIVEKKESLSAKKVLASIKSHSRLSLAQFVAGFDIEGIGETMVQKIVDGGYDTLEKILAASAADIEKIYGFAKISALNFVAGILENAEEMRSLVGKKTIAIEKNSSGVLAGKSFCFTGELSTMKRSEAESLVKKFGGTIKSSVTKDLSFLVTNDTQSGSSKNAKAAKFGIPIINEKEFLSMLN